MHHPLLGRFHLDPTFNGRIAGDVRGTLLVNSLYIPTYMRLAGTIRQGRRNGRGQWGQLSHQLLSFGSVAPPPPQLWIVDVVHFYFWLFLHVNLGPSKKIVGKIRRVFSFGYRGYLAPPEAFAPPPPASK